MKGGLWKKSLTVLLALTAGLSLGFLARQMQMVGKGEDYDLAAIRQANEDLLEEEARHLMLQTQNDDLEERKKTLLRRYEDFEEVGDILTELRGNQVLAGMTDVTGPGLHLVLDDKLNYDPLTDPIEGIIHDSTINYVVNLLWSGGARAISFNGIRLTALSEISCVGPTILCYGVRLMPPYVLEAIGPADIMRQRLESDSYLAHLTQSKIGVRLSMTEEARLLLPSFSRTHDYSAYINLLREP